MIWFIIILLSLGILYYILYPLFNPRYRLSFLPMGIENAEVEKLQVSKNEYLMAIKEIEFEYRMGKISPEDYEKLRSEYQKNVIQIYRALDELRGGKTLDQELEERILQYRKKRQKIADNKYLTEHTIFCTNCGQKLEMDYKFCTNCGRPVKHPKNLEK